MESLKEFEFPQEFEKISHIIKELLETKEYKDEKIQIELFIGDARKYIKTLDNLDIVYQDAFSSEVNGELWTVEYFTELFSITNENAVVTTYSIASNVRLSLYEAGFEIYEVNPTGKMKQTIAIKNKKDMEAKYIDMQLKQERNKELKALYD
ncbi:MnmC family methyltransferase [Arcobacter sp. F155]|uniref:MnmC family methyltransferase n=1 Tax=Arcobacter sp. F155 TaxID=2044512 RepID=UPI0028119E8F|nr:MnmC family methyltransferase [Arcobacter sp. F155]